MEEESVKTNSTILQNDIKETTAILRFEVPLKKGQGNNVIYFPDLINPPKAEITMNNQNFFTSDNTSLEQNLDEMALENFVVSETTDFLEHMAVEKRPEPKFYAISRKSTTPGFFGAGTNINPPENILQFFKNELSNDKSTNTIISNAGTIENNENKSLNKPTKSRTRKNATSSKSKGKKAIKQEEKLSSSVNEAGNKTIIKSESKYLEIQRLLEKHKRRKEKKINKDASTSGIVSSSSSKNSTPIAKSLKSLINVEDDSSLSLSSTSSTESSPKRKGRLEIRSRGSSSTSSTTVTSTKASKVNTKSKSKTSNPNNYNAESPGLTPMTISSESTPTP
ncbi:13813_t:CDS:2 [Funneliformis geosporum]|uniref:11867_t:CDS:1 n=1 Tax=Funneliformis geosporum TaxID=1117311 RepID=A0A9W4SM11_9GLOM|nr:13813_t:CDS:2 [Funneliformis geosporum]CAI2174362.1 11867_t:CDS:2 [Funneliformis geosporum]